MKRNGSARRAAPVAQAIAKSLPSWDIDLGSVQDIRQISVLVTPGEVLRDARVLVSAQPFCQDDTATWSREVAGPLSDQSDIKVGLIGRYIRVEAAHLTLEGVDVLMPHPSKVLQNTLSQDALTITEGEWRVSHVKSPSVKPSHNIDGAIAATPHRHAARDLNRRIGPDVPAEANAGGGTVHGVLRRSVPRNARGRLLARQAMAAFGFGSDDEIVFR